MSQSIAAFFDLDGTLFNGYVWRALKRHHQAHRFKLPTLYGYLLSHIALWPLRNARLISEEFFYRAWGENMAWLVRGARVERARTIWEWVTDRQILPHLRPEMQEAFALHRARGHRVVLLSGTLAAARSRRRPRRRGCRGRHTTGGAGRTLSWPNRSATRCGPGQGRADARLSERGGERD